MSASPSKQIEDIDISQSHTSAMRSHSNSGNDIGNSKNVNHRFLLLHCAVLRMNEDMSKLTISQVPVKYKDAVSEVISHTTILLHFFNDNIRNKFKAPNALVHSRDSSNLVDSALKLVSLSFNLCAVVLLPLFEVALETLVNPLLNPTIEQVKASIRCLMLKDVIPSVLEITELLIVLHNEILKWRSNLPDVPEISPRFRIERLVEIKSALSSSELEHPTEDDDMKHTEEQLKDFNNSVDHALSIIGLVTPVIDNDKVISEVDTTAIKGFVTSLQRFSAQVQTLEKLCISLCS